MLNCVSFYSEAMGSRQTAANFLDLSNEIGRESGPLLNTNRESAGPSLRASVDQNITNNDRNHRSSTSESHIDEDVVVDSSAIESIHDADEIEDSIGLSRSPTSLKCDSFKVAIMENNLRLRIEKVSFYNRIDPIRKKNVKLRRNMYKAEDALIADLVESVSDTINANK